LEIVEKEKKLRDAKDLVRKDAGSDKKRNMSLLPKSHLLLSLARYYPRNTVISVVIPQKSCFCQEGKKP